MKECIYCNTRNDNQVKACIQCGASEFNHLCAHCGTTFRSAFCPQCGVASGDAGWACPKCNAQVFGQFCQRCGHSYAAQKQAATYVVYGAPQSQGQQTPPFAAHTRSPKKKPRKRTKNSILIAIGAFVLLTALFSEPADDKKTPTGEIARETTVTTTSSPSPTPTAALTPAPIPKFTGSVINVKETANIRSAPSKDAAVLGKVALGEEVMALDAVQSEGWFRVEYNGGEGFISEEYFITDEAVAQAEKQKQHEAEAKKEKDEYQKSAKSISYNNLVREPDKYKGEIIKVTIKITQLFDNEGLFGFLCEKGYAGKQSNNEWTIGYELPEGTTRILEGDRVAFYGEFTGVQERTRALGGSKVYIPHLSAKYHEVN